jgi:hypothetical protein
MIQQDILDLFRLKPGKKVRLKDHDTGWAQTEECSVETLYPVSARGVSARIMRLWVSTRR